jgi:zinc protease
MLLKLNLLFGEGKDKDTVDFPVPLWTGSSQKGKLVFVEKEANQAFIQMGHKCIQRPHPDYYALSVLNYILGGGGFSSRLTGRVRNNEGLVYDVHSSLESNYFFPGNFTISMQTKSKSAAYAIALCKEELSAVCNNKVTAEELGSAQKSLVSSFPSMFRTGSDIAEAFLFNEYWGRPMDHFDTYVSKINALKSSDLLLAAKKHLYPDSLLIVIAGDLKACENGDGEHAAKLSDFGSLEKITTQQLEK